MDRHQPHGVEPVGLERRLALAGLREVLRDREVQEAAQVAALRVLVLARQPHELAQVREPPLAAGAREDREVVARGRDRALEQRLGREPLRAGALGGEELREAQQALAVGGGHGAEPCRAGGAGRGLAQRGPRPAAAVAARLREQDQRVAADAAERRREHAVERGLVARVGERGEVGEAVADLLLGPVAASADHVGGQALLLERLLEQAQRGGRAHEHHHVAGPAAGADLLAQAVRDQPRLRAPPRLLGQRPEPELGRVLVPAAGVGDEQLDGRRARRRVGVEQAQLERVVRRRGGLALAPGHERLEALAEDRRERGVEHVQQLRRRAEVGPQAAHALGPQERAALAEDADVGVAEAVDRLELVADREQVPALERLEQVQLQAVGVLELVDHQQREALAPARPLGVVGQQRAHAELEVVEVHAGAGGLALRVLGGEAAEQAVDQDQRGARVMVGAGTAVGLPGAPVGLAGLGRERLRAGAELGRVQLAGRRHPARGEHPRARLERAAALAHADALAGSRQVARSDVARAGQRRARGRGPLGRDRQPHLRPAAAQRVVRAEHDVAQARRIGGREVDRRAAEGGDPRLQRAVVGGRGEPPGGGRLEHAEARVEAGGQRARAQHPRAEAVDRADPRGVDGAGVLVLAEVREPPPHALAQLAGGLLGERQREDRADGHAVEQHRLDEALDHHGRLARARVGGQQRGAAAVLDRGPLLGGEAGRADHDPSTPASSAARQMPG